MNMDSPNSAANGSASRHICSSASDTSMLFTRIRNMLLLPSLLLPPRPLLLLLR
jgi:hypothetical protein